MGDWTFVVGDAASVEVDFDLRDVDDAADLAADLAGIFDDCDARQIELVFLPPPPTGLSLVHAFEAAVDGWRAAGELADVRVHVGSERARVALIDASSRAFGVDARFLFGDSVLEVRCSDIVAIAADAVVNASNTRLELGAGVSAAIRRAAGPELQAALRRIGGIQPGGVVVTGAFQMTTTQHLLHAATAFGGAAVVTRALTGIFAAAAELRLSSLALPALGTGTGGLAIEEFGTVLARVLQATPSLPERIVCVVWERADFDVLCAYFGSLDAAVD